MKLPSLQDLKERSGHTLRRFPLALISAASASGIAIYLSRISNSRLAESDPWIGLAMVAVLGIGLFTVIRLGAEQRLWAASKLALARTGGLALLGLYYLLMPDDLDTAPASFAYRYFLYFLGVHLLVAVLPYLKQGRLSAFWHYNKTLFLRFLTAVLFSGALYLGLTVALLSLDVLLGVEFEEETYLQLFLLIGGLFNTWFFLGSIPDAMNHFERMEDYPKGLKVFTQYILIPLVVVYMIILYLYMGKIIIAWSWPEGWVAYLVLSFSIVGILALLLLHPIKDRSGNRWMRTFWSAYFWILIPLVILLLLAIWVRIDAYGITVNRYFVLILSLWLGAMVCYFVLSKAQNIKIIPASLCLLAFLISFGPWGAFSVSEYSQQSRLEAYLNKYDILVEGKVQPTRASVAFEDRREISNIVSYLHEHHGTDALQPWYEQDLAELEAASASRPDSTIRVNHYEKPKYMVRLMGLQFIDRYSLASPGGMEYLQFSAERKPVLPVGDFDLLVNYSQRGDSELEEWELDDRSLSLALSGPAMTLNISTRARPGDTLHLNLEQKVEDLMETYWGGSGDIPAEMMTLSAENEYFHTRLHITGMNVAAGPASKELNSLQGLLLLRFKE